MTIKMLVKKKPLKRILFAFVITILLVNVGLINDEILNAKLKKTAYIVNDFLVETFQSSDDSIPEFEIDRASLTNHMCLIPIVDFNHSIALKHLNADIRTLNSTFHLCQSDSDILNDLVLIESNEQETYSIRINLAQIETRFKVNQNNFECQAYQFDKVINQTEELERTEILSEVYKFNVSSHEINLKQAGYYYVECFKKGLIKSKLFDNVYVVYPYNMSKLIDNHKTYRLAVDEFISHINGSQSDMMLKDTNKCNLKLNESFAKMNVLIIGIDSMSSNHFKRSFPLTFNYLKSSSLIFDRVNSVGSNTYPNMLSLFSGVVEETLSETNLTGEIDYYRNLDSTYHDHLPFIWKEFEKLGYVTMYQEDDPSIAIFNYLKKGFRYWPTCLYGRGYWLKYYQIRSGPDKCHYKEPTYLRWLNQISDFILKMNSNDLNKKTPYFSFNFLTEYTHNYFAVPWHFDAKLRDLLVSFDEKSYLNNTLLILMGDHGNRLKYYAYATEIGKLERWLPFMSVRVPDQLKSTVSYKNLQQNQNKLISFLDLYQTLRHFLHFNKYGLHSLQDECQTQFNLNSIVNRNFRGISLFADIPLNRSCSDAFIPSRVCSCFKQETLHARELKELTGETFNSVGLKILDYVNELTRKERKKCSLFKLDRVVSIKKMIINRIEVFKTVVVLSPGDAWFESNLKFNKNILKVADNPARLSPYGTQSICIKDPLIVNYCYCNLK